MRTVNIYLCLINVLFWCFTNAVQNISEISHNIRTLQDSANYADSHAEINGHSTTDNITSSWKIRHVYLYTRIYGEGKKFELLDPKNVSSITNCHFGAKQTYIIIHGFLGNGLERWITLLKDKLLKKKDCNVLSVDWPAGEKWFLPTYMSAAKRVPFVGNNTAVVLQSLINYKGLILSNVHCIGHSLGAHVCGFAGKPFKAKMARISGLDPAGPYFHNVSAKQRLSSEDASYVDVIHTNACDRWPYWTDCYGLNQDIGHSNFYPNGGKHQPGCSSLSSKVEGDIGCDHERAYKFYISSLDFGTVGTFFLARPCQNWTHFLVGNCSCGSSPQFMGWNVNTKLMGRFFLNTSSSEPFALSDDDCTFSSSWAVFIAVCLGIGLLLVFLFSLVALIILFRFVQRRMRDPDEVVGNSDAGDRGGLLDENAHH